MIFDLLARSPRDPRWFIAVVREDDGTPILLHLDEHLHVRRMSDWTRLVHLEPLVTCVSPGSPADYGHDIHGLIATSEQVAAAQVLDLDHPPTTYTEALEHQAVLHARELAAIVAHSHDTLARLAPTARIANAHAAVADGIRADRGATDLQHLDAGALLPPSDRASAYRQQAEQLHVGRRLFLRQALYALANAYAAWSEEQPEVES